MTLSSPRRSAVVHTSTALRREGQFRGRLLSEATLSSPPPLKARPPGRADPPPVRHQLRPQGGGECTEGRSVATPGSYPEHGRGGHLLNVPMIEGTQGRIRGHDSFAGRSDDE